MDYIADKTKKLSETVQGKGAEAEAKGDKGELIFDFFQFMLC